MPPESQTATNPIAIAGLAFASLTVVLYGVTFFVAGSLPGTTAELEALQSSPAAPTRFMIALGSATLLNLVALSLSTAALLVPHRPRIAAVAGFVLSGLLFIGIPGVIVVGLLGAG
jgi:hypothetical protein